MWSKRSLIDNKDGTYSVPLTRGLFALVDASDAAIVSDCNWSALSRRTATSAYYAVTQRKNVYFYLHRVILQPGVAEFVDHINGDTLDNTRSNLRICSQRDNTCNSGKRGTASTSSYKGVSLTRRGKWLAQIMVNRKCYFLGYFDTELEAAIRYNGAAREYFGAFARVNEIDAAIKTV